MRGGFPERDSAVHGRVVAGKLRHACRVRVQTPALKDLTDAACMPDLTVEEYGGEEACEAECQGHVTIDAVSRVQVRVTDEGFVQYFPKQSVAGGGFLLAL